MFCWILPVLLSSCASIERSVSSAAHHAIVEAQPIADPSQHLKDGESKFLTISMQCPSACSQPGGRIVAHFWAGNTDIGDICDKLGKHHGFQPSATHSSRSNEEYGKLGASSRDESGPSADDIQSHIYEERRQITETLKRLVKAHDDLQYMIKRHREDSGAERVDGVSRREAHVSRRKADDVSRREAHVSHREDRGGAERADDASRRKDSANHVSRRKDSAKDVSRRKSHMREDSRRGDAESADDASRRKDSSEDVSRRKDSAEDVSRREVPMSRREAYGLQWRLNSDSAETESEDDVSRSEDSDSPESAESVRLSTESGSAEPLLGSRDDSGSDTELDRERTNVDTIHLRRLSTASADIASSGPHEDVFRQFIKDVSEHKYNKAAKNIHKIQSLFKEMVSGTSSRIIEVVFEALTIVGTLQGQFSRYAIEHDIDNVLIMIRERKDLPQIESRLEEVKGKIWKTDVL